MADNITTPVPDGKVLALKEIGGILFALNLIADAAGVDAMGLVAANPAAYTMLGRLKTIADGVLAATPAGENYMGKIGGDVLLSAPAAPPTVSASAYAAGQVIGTKFTLPNAARVAAGAGLIQAASLLSKTATTAAIDMIIFSADPTASTLTDKTAPTIAAADIDKIVGVIHLTDWSALGAAALAQNLAVGLPFRLPAGTSLYAVLIARAAITPGSTADLLPAVRIIPG
ncbi:hypothetical protein CA234_09680 [Sphingomonas sp. ABOLE]|uniref:hypothetical protein n=1 Tax=Sphingomonas sp. ABOLE TaxID=1985878 RepID=UPI000F7E2BBC|nr:hypothetical protein [Sphingomonas sp. ABOLE]RSV41528.1 hypothetical protein CA234_09680 [Sphingomonas sp. ABOLE]